MLALADPNSIKVWKRDDNGKMQAKNRTRLGSGSKQSFENFVTKINIRLELDNYVL